MVNCTRSDLRLYSNARSVVVVELISSIPTQILLSAYHGIWWREAKRSGGKCCMFAFPHMSAAVLGRDAWKKPAFGTGGRCTYMQAVLA